MELHENIKTMRLARDMTQQELASALGYSRAAVTQIERGGVDLPISRIRQIADFFDVSVSDLLGEESGKRISLKDRILLDKIRSLDPEQQRFVGMVIDREIGRKGR